jgi:hypothetical protein
VAKLPQIFYDAAQRSYGQRRGARRAVRHVLFGFVDIQADSGVVRLRWAGSAAIRHLDAPPHDRHGSVLGAGAGLH